LKTSLIFPIPPEKGTFCGTVKGAEEYNKEKIDFYGFPPMGMLSLATYLSENNFDVSILDQFARGLSIDETLKWIKYEDPDILGFSTITTAGTGRSSAEIARRVKEEINPNIKILFGNYHATFNDTRILNKYPFIDACVRGEGEYTLLEIVENAEKGRSFEDIRPPALDKSDKRYPGLDPIYGDLSENEIPSTECLKDTSDRFLPYWHDEMVPIIKKNKRAIVAAHGNSLRALVKYLDNISDEEIVSLNIPTGIPLVYELDEELKSIRHYYLGDPEEIKKATEVVKNQGKIQL